MECSQGELFRGGEIERRWGWTAGEHQGRFLSWRRGKLVQWELGPGVSGSGDQQRMWTVVLGISLAFSPGCLPQEPRGDLGSDPGHSQDGPCWLCGYHQMWHCWGGGASLHARLDAAELDPSSWGHRLEGGGQWGAAGWGGLWAAPNPSQAPSWGSGPVALSLGPPLD